MKLRVRRPSKAARLAGLALAGAGAALVGMGRLFSLEVALVVGGLAAVAYALLADAD